MSSNWSELPYDLLIEIAEHINKVEDFVVFGAVCKAWSTAGKKKYFKGLWLRQGIPYMLLPVTDQATDVREFYSLVDGEVVASVSIPKFRKRKCHESLGWLLASEEDGNMYLLNPFSSVEIPLPHQSTLRGYVTLSLSMDAFIFVQKFVLSSRPNETSDYEVMIICGEMEHLAFWRPGNKSWIRIKIRDGGYSDVMYHGGHYYAIDNLGYARVLTLQRGNPSQGRILTRLVVDVANNLHDKNNSLELVMEKNLYILKTSQSLFMITRNAFWLDEENDKWCYDTSKFQVYEVDMSVGTWTEIYNLGNMAVFVGHNTTFAIDTSRLNGKIKSNHIYFCDDGWEPYHFFDEKGGGKDMGVYSLETGTIESFYTGEMLLTKICPYIWVTPCF